MTEDETKAALSAMRDKARLDFLQEHKCDLRENKGEWWTVSLLVNDIEPQESAREAIDVAMAFAKEAVIPKT